MRGLPIPTPRIGDKVTVRGGFGYDPPEDVTITGLGEKNGRPLFDYIDSGGQSRWAYYDQIIQPVRRP